MTAKTHQVVVTEGQRKLVVKSMFALLSNPHQMHALERDKGDQFESSYQDFVSLMQMFVELQDNEDPKMVHGFAL